MGVTRAVVAVFKICRQKKGQNDMLLFDEHQ